VTTSSAELSEKLNGLCSGYARQLPERIREVEEELGRLLQAPGDPRSAERLQHLLHTMIGSSGTLGYSGVSSAAAALKALVGTCSDPGLRGDSLRSQAAGHIARLKKSARRRDADVLDALLAGDEPDGTEGENRLICVLEDDPVQASGLAVQLGHYGYEVRTFARIEDLNRGLDEGTPVAVIVDIILPEGPLAGARGIGALRALRKIPAPVLFLTVRDDLHARVEAFRAGADAYFTKPGDVAALLERLDVLTARRLPEPYRVLVADDDVILSQFIGATLRQAGMTVTIVNDPWKIEEPLRELRPDVLLMDLDMPGCSGLELGGAIRQQQDFLGIPIVFLSSETQVERQFAARSVGAEDFLVKPIKGDRLIAELTLRIERARSLRAQMARDSHTGLLNHSSFMSLFQTEVARARRRNAPLAFAMFDVDRFKSVNDVHGHPAGDRVLRSLAHVLRKRLRATDLVGRCGGDEFGAVLVDTDGENAARVLDEVRAAFAGIRHASSTGSFSVTISTGVASFPAIPDAKLLQDAADQAMYFGKRQGGNRVTIFEE
jgi:diguanylate cyclase (GGDEF)-like protein